MSVLRGWSTPKRSLAWNCSRCNRVPRREKFKVHQFLLVTYLLPLLLHMLSSSVLKHPQGAAVAERITESLTPTKDLLTFSPNALCKRCYHMDHLSSGSLSALRVICNASPGSGKEFHWACALRYIVSPALSPELVQWVTKVAYYGNGYWAGVMWKWGPKVLKFWGPRAPKSYKYGVPSHWMSIGKFKC